MGESSVFECCHPLDLREGAMLGVFQELGSYLSRSLSGAQARRPCPGTALKPVLLCVHVHACQVASVVSNSATAWTVAHQAPLSMEFSRQEYWSGLPCLLPGDLPDPGIEPSSLMSPALTGWLFTSSATWETQFSFCVIPNSVPLTCSK